MIQRAVSVALIQLSLIAASEARADDQGGIKLEDLVRETKVALQKVAADSQAESLPALSQIVLTVNAVQKQEADGHVGFWVAKVGSKLAADQSSTIELTLVPPPPQSGSDVESVQFADVLAASLLSTARAIKIAGQGRPPLVAKKLTATLHFGIEIGADGHAGIEFPPFSAEAGGEVSSAGIQTVEVTYATGSE